MHDNRKPEQKQFHDFEHDHCQHHLHTAAEEVPIIFSYENNRTSPILITGAELTEIYKDSLESINQWCQTEHVLIGHIKLQLRANGAACWASCTGQDISVRRTADWDKLQVSTYHLIFTAIVFQTTLPKLEAAVTARVP